MDGDWFFIFVFVDFSDDKVLVLCGLLIFCFYGVDVLKLFNLIIFIKELKDYI